MKIVEEYDGRLPYYNVVDKEEVLGTFDTEEEAQLFIETLKNGLQ